MLIALGNHVVKVGGVLAMDIAGIRTQRCKGGEVSPSPVGGKCAEGWRRLDEVETRLVKAEAMAVEIV
jgi:hypothetical protein